MNKVFDDFLVNNIKYIGGVWSAENGRYQPQINDYVTCVDKINGRIIAGDLTEITEEFITVDGNELRLNNLCFIGKE